MANMLVKDFKGEVPLTVEELMKTAGCWKKNGQCDYFSDRPATQYGRRYSCVPCCSTHWFNHWSPKHHSLQKNS